jgi:hypothetical protein
LPTARNGWSSVKVLPSSVTCTGVDQGPPGNARVLAKISQLLTVPTRNDEKYRVSPSYDRCGPESAAVLFSAGLEHRRRPEALGCEARGEQQGCTHDTDRE